MRDQDVVAVEHQPRAPLAAQRHQDRHQRLDQPLARLAERRLQRRGAPLRDLALAPDPLVEIPHPALELLRRQRAAEPRQLLLLGRERLLQRIDARLQLGRHRRLGLVQLVGRRRLVEHALARDDEDGRGFLRRGRARDEREQRRDQRRRGAETACCASARRHAPLRTAFRR